MTSPWAGSASCQGNLRSHRRLLLCGLLRVRDHVYSDLRFQFLGKLDGNSEGPKRPNGVWQINHTSINGDTLGIAQASSNILASDRAIEATFASRSGFKGQGDFSQALRLLPIEFC